MRTDGFTLVEVLIVVAIVVILAVLIGANVGPKATFQAKVNGKEFHPAYTTTRAVHHTGTNGSPGYTTWVTDNHPPRYELFLDGPMGPLAVDVPAAEWGNVERGHVRLVACTKNVFGAMVRCHVGGN